MGTAAVMLGAALSLFGVVGTLVSFGAWPGLGAHEKVDSVLVESVTTRTTEPIRVSTRPGPASAQRADAARTTVGTPVAASPRPGVPVTRVPGAPVPPPAAPAPTQGGGDGDRGAQQPAGQAPPEQVVERTTGELNRTVETVNEQVGSVVEQIGGGVERTVDGAGGTLAR